MFKNLAYCITLFSLPLISFFLFILTLVTPVILQDRKVVASKANVFISLHLFNRHRQNVSQTEGHGY